MSDIINWGTLAKSILDGSTIDDEIIAAIATHNASDNAHGQSSESLYNHRIAEVIDHLNNSITPEKFDNSMNYYFPKFETIDCFSVYNDLNMNVANALYTLEVGGDSPSSGYSRILCGSDYILTNPHTSNFTIEFEALFSCDNESYTCFFGPGYPSLDGCGFYYHASKFYVFTASNPNEYEHEITGIDVSQNHKYKIVCVANTSVKFYIDDVLIYTETNFTKLYDFNTSFLAIQMHFTAGNVGSVFLAKYIYTQNSPPL